MSVFYVRDKSGNLIPIPAIQGPPGPNGAPGATPYVGANGNWYIGTTDTGVKAAGPAGADGQPGKDGTNGKDGVSATHSWNGTVLTITSASGTSSADLKGAKGDKGDQGIQGEPGAKGETGATGSQGPKGDTGSQGEKGDTGAQGPKGDKGEKGEPGKDGANGVTPHVGSNGNWFIGDNDTGIPATGPAGGQGLPGTPGVDGKDGISATHTWNGTVLTVTSASGTSSADLKGAKGEKGEQGPAGAAGKNGSDAAVTAENIVNALGYVPAGAGTNSPLTGKKIVYDGDSICAAAFSYPKLIADKTACIFENQAVGGARLCAVSDRHSVVNNLTNLPTDGDIYCFEGGINDWWANTPVGTFAQGDYTGAVDATTIYGAMETICRYAITNFFGKAICFVIVHKVQNSAYSQNTAGHTFWDYRKAMIDVCEKYSIPYYDAFVKSGLNGWNAAQKAGLFVSGDGTHPNEVAYEAYYVPQLISLFESIVPVGDYEAPAKPVTYENVLKTKTVDADGNPYNGGKGYKEDSYLNGSGVEQSSTNYDVTGFIECKIGDVFRLKNVQFCKNVNGNSKCQIQYYKSDKSLMSVTGYLKDPTGLSDAWQAVTNDAGTDIIQFTVPTSLNATLGYIRLTCGTLTDASIITVNEEID